METRLDIKFRLKPRKAKNSIYDIEGFNTENVLITMRVTYDKMRLEFTTGYHIDARYWDAVAERAIGNGSDGKTAEEINKGLTNLSYAVRATAVMFSERGYLPTQEEFKASFQRIKSGGMSAYPNPVKPKRGRPRKSEKQDKISSQSLQIGQNAVINNYSENKVTVNNNQHLSLWEVYHEYEAYAGKLNDWSIKTRKKYETIRFNLRSFRDWKRQHGLPNFEVTFDYLDEDGLQAFVDYLRDVKKYVNNTIRKDVVMLKVVIRWAYRKRYHTNNMFEAFRPALKSAKQKVIFFNKKELERLEKFEIPETKLYLIRTRDVFLFQCYTGIRYSDLANLRRCDVHEKYIEITTVKTIDSLRIELNSHSRAILKKYEPFDFKDGKALPVASNQKMNQYLHELCEMVGFDEPIRITYYRGCERFDEIKPKYKLVGTHTGRRSFICNALGMGISPQVVMKWTGHSDYKAMKPYIDVCDEIKAEAMKKFDDF